MTRAVALGACVALASACASTTDDRQDVAHMKATETSEVRRPPKPCIEKLEVTSDTSLDTVPMAGSDLSDFPRSVSAVHLDYRHSPEPRLAAIELSLRPVFFAVSGVDGKGRPWPTVTDAVLFSNLQCVDATRVRSGQTYPVGHATEAALRSGPQRIASALVRSGVIRPFVHMSASLCLVDQREHPDQPQPAAASAAPGSIWTGRYEGTHTFFTNQKNVSPVAFLVHIARSGNITVGGL